MIYRLLLVELLQAQKLILKPPIRVVARNWQRCLASSNNIKSNTNLLFVKPNLNNKCGQLNQIIKSISTGRWVLSIGPEEANKSHDNKNLIFTIPNCLTMLRIFSIPFINYFIFIDRHDIACGLFVMASLTDFLDGFIARNVPNQLSYLGNFEPNIKL